MALYDSSPIAHTRLGWIHLRMGNHEQAIAEGQQAIDLDPSYAEAYAGLAEFLNASDRLEEGLRLIKKAMRFNPHYPAK